MGIPIWSTVNEEVSQGYPLRKPLFSKISKHFEDRYVVSLYTAFESSATINDSYPEMLNALLRGAKKLKNRNILFLIHSRGGDPLSAEKIIKVLCEFSDNDYWVLVPGTAKSAATMICLGANKIILSPISELGPIDLQVLGERGLISTHSIVTAYDRLMNKGIKLKEKDRIEPILQQLQEFQASEIEHFRRVNKLSSDMAVKILKRGMFNKLSLSEIKKLIKLFIDPEQSKVHGRPIYFSDIQEVDKKGKFNLELIDMTSNIWSTVTEYHTRVITHLRVTKNIQLIESEEMSFSAGG